MRRRQRRLRSWLRHERMTVSMALAEVTHHTAPGGQKTARASGEERDELYDAKGLMTPPPSRPTPLVEVRPQVGLERHFLEHMADICPYVQILDAPVPQTVGQLPDVLRFFDTLIPVAEQVIDVPKIFIERIPPRTSVREPHLAEQLVEVPTIVSYSSLERSMEQHVDIPVPRRGGEFLVFEVFFPDRVQQRSSDCRADSWFSCFSWRPSRFSPRTGFILFFARSSSRSRRLG